MVLSARAAGVRKVEKCVFIIVPKETGHTLPWSSTWTFQSLNYPLWKVLPTAYTVSLLSTQHPGLESWYTQPKSDLWFHVIYSTTPNCLLLQHPLPNTTTCYPCLIHWCAPLALIFYFHYWPKSIFYRCTIFKLAPTTFLPPTEPCFDNHINSPVHHAVGCNPHVSDLSD